MEPENPRFRDELLALPLEWKEAFMCQDAVKEATPGASDGE